MIYEAPVSSRSGAMRFPFLTSDLQSTQNVGFDELPGASLHDASASPTLEGTAKYVLKFARPESTGLSEVNILEEAVEIGEKDEKVRGDLSVLLSLEALKYTTIGIRSMLGICDGNEKEREGRGKNRQTCRGSRTCRLLAFEELHEIETVKSGSLLKAFADIVDCHYALWISGIKHCDISPGNLMWNRDDKSGVLIDCDLARMDIAAHRQNLERTDTIPFLSLDLLQNILKFRQGGIELTYKHDCDSLKWVFLYCVEQRSEVSKWLTADMEKFFAIRTAYLFPRPVLRLFNANYEKLPLHGEEVYWLLCKAHAALANHNVAFRMGQGPEVYVGPTNLELYNVLKDIIQRLPI